MAIHLSSLPRHRGHQQCGRTGIASSGGCAENLGWQPHRKRCEDSTDADQHPQDVLVTSKVFKTIGCDDASAVVLAVASSAVRDSRVARRFCSDFLSAGSWTASATSRSEEHTSELQSQSNLVCRLLLEKKHN